MKRFAARFAALLAGIGLMPCAVPAHADASVCNEAYVATQELQKDGKLRAARAAALVCAQDACTTTVRTSCARWLDDIERATPSILVEARDGAGNELSAVKVGTGNETLVERLDGRAFDVDPGSYALRFEYGDRVVVKSFVFREAEKYRRILVEFTAPDAAPSPIVPEHRVESVTPDRARASGREASGFSAPRAPDVAHTTASRPPALSYAFGGVGIASLVLFAALATSGYASERDLRDTCGKTRSCDPDDVESIRTRYRVADVALGAGVSLLTGAALLWAFGSSPARSGPTGARALRLGARPSFERAGAQIELEGAF